MPGFCLAVIRFPAVTIEQTREGGVWWISVCGMWSSAGSQPAATCRDPRPPTAEEIPLKSSGSKTTLERDARERQQVSFDASCHTGTAKFFFSFKPAVCNGLLQIFKKMCQFLYLHVQKTVSGMRSGGVKGPSNCWTELWMTRYGS